MTLRNETANDPPYGQPLDGPGTVTPNRRQVLSSLAAFSGMMALPGRALAEAVIEFARSRGARDVILVSDSQLAPAIHRYEAMGFQH